MQTQVKGFQRKALCYTRKQDNCFFSWFCYPKKNKYRVCGPLLASLCFFFENKAMQNKKTGYIKE